MTLRTGFAALCLLCGLAPAALAQDEEEATGDPIEMPEDEEPGAPLFDESGELSGADETPGDPNAVFNANPEPDATVVSPREIRSGYPQERVLRPLTLPQGMVEVALGLPVRSSPFSTTAVLRGSYGLSDQVQLGLAWGAGALHEDGFETGKALALDVRYHLADWVAAQLALPFYVDPFALGVGLGAPIRLTLFDKVALEAGENLFELSVYRFFPQVDNQVANAQLEMLDATNTSIPCCRMNLIGQLVYQLDPQSAVDLRFGIRRLLETSAGYPPDTPVLLDVGYLFASSNMLDFAARVGFERLDEIDSFNVQLMAALRL